MAFATGGSGLAVAVGNAGCILVSRDGGGSWIATEAPSAIDYHGVAATPDGFWVIGDHGVLLHAASADLDRAQAIALTQIVPPIDAGGKLQEPPPTPRQRAFARVGDYTITREQVPMLKVDYTMKKSVTAVTEKDATITIEVIEGSPPHGAPKQQTVTLSLSSFGESDHFVIGKTQVDEGVGPMHMKVTSRRLPNETVPVGGKEVACMVVDMTAETPKGEMTVKTRIWQPLGTDVPLQDFVKLQRTQESDTPTGKITLSLSDAMVEFKRGPDRGK